MIQHMAPIKHEEYELEDGLNSEVLDCYEYMVLNGENLDGPKEEEKERDEWG